MKQLIIIVCILLPGFALYAQKEKKYIHKGNELYMQKKYAEAEASYRQSVEKSKESVQGNFNLGDALFRQKKFDNAAQKFTDIASSSENKQVKAGAYHNLGNSLLESKKLEESIAAYKKSLMNNPKDDETRYNLAYAMEKLKEQEKNKDKNDKDKNKDKKDQNQKNKDKKDQDKKDDKNKQDQKKDENKDQDKKDQKDQQNGQQPQPDQLSKEDAERMLEALKNEEKNTQDKLRNKKAKGVKGRIVKDW
ncbi:MAG TPA: tetratricopeptide repeat protein [Pedobacter sp.]|uniref:tetratricopeptide repeat protein n=1 Tax=Pedobacter sp. TaxID=1411316 RepID=UPI002C31C7EE|nr:tetratricopeptide repeat protein [Pedobacter sp.]HMI01247.1 tetratricopeptide repeat protein [Pedobacter sp.]